MNERTNKRRGNGPPDGGVCVVGGTSGGGGWFGLVWLMIKLMNRGTEAKKRPVPGGRRATCWVMAVVLRQQLTGWRKQLITQVYQLHAPAFFYFFLAH